MGVVFLGVNNLAASWGFPSSIRHPKIEKFDLGQPRLERAGTALIVDLNLLPVLPTGHPRDRDKTGTPSANK